MLRDDILPCRGQKGHGGIKGIERVMDRGIVGMTLGIAGQKRTFQPDLLGVDRNPPQLYQFLDQSRHRSIPGMVRAICRARARPWILVARRW